MERFIRAGHEGRVPHDSISGFIKEKEEKPVCSVLPFATLCHDAARRLLPDGGTMSAPCSWTAQPPKE